MTSNEAREKCIEAMAEAAANRYWRMPSKEHRPSKATWDNCGDINKSTWREIERAAFDAIPPEAARQALAPKIETIENHEAGLHLEISPKRRRRSRE